MRIIGVTPVAVVMAALMLSLPATAACRYTVKPNGKYLTRPAYTLTNGVLAKTKERAPVGATCDTKYKPTKPSGKDLWASYDSTDKVALCSKR